jgi:hypothetical protein
MKIEIPVHVSSFKTLFMGNKNQNLGIVHSMNHNIPRILTMESRNTLFDVGIKYEVMEK